MSYLVEIGSETLTYSLWQTFVQTSCRASAPPLVDTAIVCPPNSSVIHGLLKKSILQRILTLIFGQMLVGRELIFDTEKAPDM